MSRIRKDDQVVVIAGKDKGKTGKVLSVLPERQRAVVENINMMKKTRRKSQKDPQGGVVEIESSIHLSNLMLLDRKTNKPTRVRFQVQKDGTKTRISKKSGEVI
jgi:large subunit ribosomal protein L24